MGEKIRADTMTGLKKHGEFRKLNGIIRPKHNGSLRKWQEMKKVSRDQTLKKLLFFMLRSMDLFL